jgi:hypothetical protein
MRVPPTVSFGGDLTRVDQKRGRKGILGVILGGKRNQKQDQKAEVLPSAF